MHRLIIITYILMLFQSCGRNDVIEKHYAKRDNILDISSNITPIDVGDLYVGRGTIAIINEYLIMTDYKALSGNFVNILNKNTFEQIWAGIPKGRGPGEIISLGSLVVDESNNRFFITDNGKYVIYEYNIDSMLLNSQYMPSIKTKLNKSLFPRKYQYINDSLCYGTLIEPIGNTDFIEPYGKWNMLTGEISNVIRNSPKKIKKRIWGYASIENNVIVEAYSRNDVISIYNLNGDIKYNVYGPLWSDKSTSYHYRDVRIWNDIIITTYSGKDRELPYSYLGDTFIIYDIDGYYIKNINVGLNIMNFCIDEENNRIIIAVDDEKYQLLYFNLDLILK